MIGKTLGRYRVLEKIGRGGMGEVFLAEDTSLHRRVALKFLPPEMQQDAEAHKRFIREARSAAALDHPYICHINEVAEAEGRDFIVMEYVDGQALRAKIGQGPLSIGETLQIGMEVAEALEAARGKNIVHRDIKPENIMLTRTGHAKVMDFGLAKQMVSPEKEELGGPTMTLLTSEGTTVGTLAYMSPEQLRGLPADARSDIWSLGVTVYEMASGVRPFQGQSGFEVSSAILNRAPLPLPAGVPAELGAVVGRCLEKDPAKRYQTAQDLRAALEEIRAGTASMWAAWRYRLTRRRWLVPAAGMVIVAVLVFALDVGGLRTLLTGGPGAEGRPFKLAVLPFENLTGDPEQEYLSDGMTQEMISQLSSLHPARMGVIARASVMRYKKSEAPLEQIGQELGVAYILEGTARREGNRIRISAELIKVRDQTKLWDETYDREMSGILVLQSDIARRVAGALTLRLLPSEEARLTRVRTVDPEAYEAFLKGTQQRESLTKAGFDAAEQYFNFATEKDPSYAAPWAGIGSVWNGRIQLSLASREEGILKAKSAALKAIALDDREAEAHRTLAGILTWLDWDYEAADRAWIRVFEIDPGHTYGLASYAHFLMIMDRRDEAFAKIERALELDPHNIMVQSFYAQVLLGARRYDDAIAVARKVLSLQPNTGVAITALIGALFKKGLYEELLALERERWAKDAEILEALEKGHLEAGYPGAVKRLADVLAARYGKPGGPRAYIVANSYARAGDIERVIEWLEKAYEEHDNSMPYIGGNPHFDLVRSDPRFQDLVRRVGVRIIN
ncbi:MAG: protein kinase [Candidatus Aminicenantes bacterium]|nr:protein kinase [Candidatus Aminicenantes bacterium]